MNMRSAFDPTPQAAVCKVNLITIDVIDHKSTHCNTATKSDMTQFD